mgnify:CR=1 FL=1
MLTPTDQEVLRRAYTPQLEAFLDAKLQSLLNDLPNVSLETVQKFQGRALELKELLSELRFAAGVTANRTAKPQL